MTSVSVVLALYNGRRYLEQQMRSILDQLEPGDELLVVDDASTDDSLAILERLRTPALRLVSNESNMGVIRSFERGLRLAANEIVFLCDQDDVWFGDKREAMVHAFEADPKVLAVVSDVEVIDSDGNVTNRSFMAGRRGFRAGVWATLWRNRYLGCAMALRRSLLAWALPIPPTVPMHDMWFGVLAKSLGNVVYIPRALMQYRRHGSNVTPDRPQSVGQMLRWRVALARALIERLLSVRFHRTVAKS